ncbi:uncharacterized protein TrAtP1_002815 [Trichoderma atroviride]|uniref:uncharacterized protein n=1 Tax=Hypocrea atroviridis TaxID=63577 RepID=UPI00332C3441|nr:hypothetical protein TrAtP1_002815 [Trichoderma atroviride]
MDTNSWQWLFGGWANGASQVAPHRPARLISSGRLSKGRPSESPESTAAEAAEAADLRQMQIMECPANQSLPQFAVDTTFTA